MPGAEIFKKILSGHVVVEISDFKYKGRLVIPDVAQRKPSMGHVIAKADDVEEINVGDKVLYSAFAGYPLQFQQETIMRVMQASEVIAIMAEDSPELEVE